MLVVASGNAEKAFLHWDGYWYKDIVDNGYDNAYPPYAPSAPECNLNTDNCIRNFTFFPMYPMLVEAGSLTGIGSFSSGFIVSNLMYLGSILILFKLAKEFFNDEKKAYISAFALMLTPPAFVFSAYMTESTFVFLFILAYYLAYHKKWLWAGLAGLCLSATRNTGVLFAVSYLLIWLEQNKFNFKSIFKDWRFILGGIFIPVGLLLFMLYLQIHVGDALGFVNLQKYWRGADVAPNMLTGFIRSFYVWKFEVNPFNHLYDLAYFIALAGLFIINLKKKWLPLSMSIILLWIIIPMTTGSTKSLPRYAIVLFPIYLFIPLIFKGKWARVAYFAASTIGMIAFSVFYTKGLAITI